jgi:tRNA threonylcarbamoyladenosine biosynthesis protein TsaE
MNSWRHDSACDWPVVCRPNFEVVRYARNNLPEKVLSLSLPEEAATQALGARLARVVSPGITVHLIGDLGAGKTTLVRALLRALGYAGRVKSPTYTLVELYNLSNLCFYHFDFYRFTEPGEWIDAGFREYFGPQAVCFVEWPEKAGALLPPPDLEIRLAIEGECRRAEIHAFSAKGLTCLTALAAG